MRLPVEMIGVREPPPLLETGIAHNEHNPHNGPQREKRHCQGNEARYQTPGVASPPRAKMKAHSTEEAESRQDAPRGNRATCAFVARQHQVERAVISNCEMRRDSEIESHMETSPSMQQTQAPSPPPSFSSSIIRGSMRELLQYLRVTAKRVPCGHARVHNGEKIALVRHTGLCNTLYGKEEGRKDTGRERVRRSKRIMRGCM